MERVSLPVKNIVDGDPSDELKRRNRSLYSGYEAMYIAADLSDKTQSRLILNKLCHWEEHLVCVFVVQQSDRLVDARLIEISLYALFWRCVFISDCLFLMIFFPQWNFA